MQNQAQEGICETPDIGRDLMFEILVQLPIKSLLRCKTVSKDWFELISSPEFIKFRHQCYCDDPDYTHHKLLFVDQEYGNPFRQAPLHPILSDPSSFDDLETCISHPLKFQRRELSQLTFVGSCRGLVCIASLNFDFRVHVWNPALRKCKRLPNFGAGAFPVFYGFGYDESSDDFKVVGIRNAPKIVVKIYSARTNSWKELEDDGFKVDQVDGHGCFLNGKLHWATQNKSILTIDLSSERFGVMEPPNCMDAEDFQDWSLPC